MDSPHFKGLTAILAPRLDIIAFKTVGDSHRESVRIGFSEEVEFRLRNVNADETLSTDLQKECSRRRNGQCKGPEAGLGEACLRALGPPQHLISCFSVGKRLFCFLLFLGGCVHACLLACWGNDKLCEALNLGFSPLTRFAFRIPHPVGGRLCPGTRLPGSVSSHHTTALVFEPLVIVGCNQPVGGSGRLGRAGPALQGAQGNSL